MRKISVWLAGALVLTAIVVTFLTTLFLERRAADRRQDKLLEAADLIQAEYVGGADRDAMTDAAVSAMVESLGDRWSYYLTADDLAEYRNFEQNHYQGLGMVVGAGDNGGVFIQTVYRQSSAGRAGVQPGSRITGINGTDTWDADLSEVLSLVTAGIANGLVELETMDSGGEKRVYALEPGEVDTDPVSWELLEDGLGLIRISNFEDRSGTDTLTAIEDLLGQGAVGLVFDVRDNPGGQLQQLLMILDRLLPEGILFISKDNGGKVETEYSDANCLDLPMAVLVNGGSYSAAEFFAAALQEYDWAEIIGEQTTGKGYAQVTYLLSDGSAIHLSTVEYFTPQGKSLAGQGITPDILMELEDEPRQKLTYGLLEHELDTQLQAACETLLNELRNKP